MKDWKGNKGWGLGGGDMENKQTRQQTGRGGGHKASFVSVLAAALAAAMKKKKKTSEGRGWIDDGVED